MCDDLCAGKILHPTLFQFNDPGAMTLMRWFEQECSYLSAIRHPNVVQYLGLYQDPETQLPVLLMELMDENLTQFLERNQDSLPYHTQVHLCHDIALALVHLHSNGIIHCDLSSNNMLLIGAGNRAKVSGFGMAKVFHTNFTTLTSLTMCPGTLAYIPPEALDNLPVYTDKLFWCTWHSDHYTAIYQPWLLCQENQRSTINNWNAHSWDWMTQVTYQVDLSHPPPPYHCQGLSELQYVRQAISSGALPLPSYTDRSPPVLGKCAANWREKQTAATWRRMRWTNKHPQATDCISEVKERQLQVLSQQLLANE